MQQNSTPLLPPPPPSPLPIPPHCSESMYKVAYRLQICPCFGGRGGVLGHELGDFADEVGLFGAAFTGLAPLLQNLLQVLHLELLQVHCVQIQLFVVFQFTDLTVLLLELLADPVHRDVVTEWPGHLVDHLCGCVACCADVVTKSVLFAFGISAALHHGLLNVGTVEVDIVILQLLVKLPEKGDAHFTLALFQCVGGTGHHDERQSHRQAAETQHVGRENSAG